MGYLKNRGKSFYYAFRGIKRLFASEANAQIHLLAAILVISAGFIFHISKAEWIAVLICIGGVFMAEAFNTAIEAVCDKVSPEYSRLIEKAKDVAAGAVLLFVFACIAIGLIIFLPKIISLFQ